MDRPFHCFAQTARMRRAMIMAIAAVVLVLAGCPNPAGSDGSDGSGGDNGTDGSGNGQAIAVTEVSLDQSSLSLTVGETATLTATVQPSDASDSAVSWSSDNTAVATVSDAGEVTAVAEGSAVITVTTADGSLTATADVTVSSQSGDGSINVDFQNPDDLEVSISGVPGEIAQRDGFTASASGYDSYSWYLNGSTTNVALSPSGTHVDVDTGSLTPGTHTLSVFAETGGNTYSGQASFTVTEPSVTSLAGTRIILGAGLSSPALSGADAPGVTWTTSDPAVATVADDGTVTAVGQGTASITVDDPGFGSLGSVPVVVARAFYELDGNPSDSTGNGHDATNNSAAPTADRNGTASAAFDVSSANLSIADGEIGLGSAFSVAFWMRWDEVPSAYNSMVDKDYSASGFSIGLNSGGSVDLDYPTELAGVNRTMRTYLSDSALSFSNGHDFNAGTPEWVHVIITFSDADDESKLYIDGTLSEAVADTRSNTDNNASILIGNAAPGDNFKGVIDDLVFFNKALSHAEAADLAGF